MQEHNRDHDAASDQSEAAGEARRRGCRITGLSDLLPDWLLDQEGKQHVRNARKEALLAARRVLDKMIERQEAGPQPRRTVSRVEID